LSQRSYYSLIASLPHLPMHFEQVDRTPITRARLAERLRLLHPRDREVIDQVASFLIWDRQPLDRSDEEVIARYDTLMKEVSSPLVRKVINTRIDVRTIISAMRRRRAGNSPPPGIGQWVDHIRRNWNHPEFNLAGRYPWISDVQRMIGEGRAHETQRLLFGVVYRTWSQMAERYTFSFEAVILYLARWEIIDRWTSQNVEIGRQRFDKLITETLGVYANIY
jgi:hypothetical protein